ncbi:MAG: type II toxin-antitoxin system VapC family toxin [Candidatus Rokubacteria bacterium]|nr:type II toxin-antitoxin system VapC family toxin [Candidatus Rokubacteria bacterium]
MKWFFDEPYSDQALRLRQLFQTGIYHPLGPDLVYPEFANVVWKRVMFEGLDPEDGAAVLSAFASIPFEIVPSLPLLAMAYRLGLEHQQSIYDALFLALSVATDADLVTADEPFYQAVHPRFPRVRWLATWPSR